MAVGKSFQESNVDERERQQIETLKHLMAEARKLPPTDAGHGWLEVQLPKHPMFANSRSYQKHLPPGFLICMVERRFDDDKTMFPDGRWHLSLSHNMMVRAPGAPNTPGRFPTWDEIKEARYKFTPPDVNMALMFPPVDLYYNRHETCLHLLEIPSNLALDPKTRGGI